MTQLISGLVHIILDFLFFQNSEYNHHTSDSLHRNSLFINSTIFHPDELFSYQNCLWLLHWLSGVDGGDDADSVDDGGDGGDDDGDNDDDDGGDNDGDDDDDAVDAGYVGLPGAEK